MITTPQFINQPAIDVPEPGIYSDIPFDVYLSWPAVSNSKINQARRSLLHFKEQVTEETEALRLGRFLHCGVLEPLAILQRYVVMPSYEFDKENVTQQGKPSTATTTTYYQNKKAEFEAINAGKEIVSETDYATLIGISKGLMRSAKAREYLTERGESEVSMIWVDPDTGLLCKARIDLLNSGINDFKSTLDAMKMAQAIARYGYHRQGAHYQRGYEILAGELKSFRLIAAEKKSPHGVRAAPLNEDAIDQGRSELRETMRAIKGAYESNQWPCYEDPSSWCLPSYYSGDDEPIELTIDGQTVSL